MSLNFTILDEREAPLDNVLYGPNPAEEPGATNDAINDPVPGLNDGFDVGEENVGNVPVSDRSRSDKKNNSSGQKPRKKSLFGRTLDGRNRKGLGRHPPSRKAMEAGLAHRRQLLAWTRASRLSTESTRETTPRLEDFFNSSSATRSNNNDEADRLADFFNSSSPVT